MPVPDPIPAAFRRLARARQGEGVHTRGAALAGTLVVRPRSDRTGAALLDVPDRYAVRARLSWGFGFLRGLPDVPGLAVRVLDADGRGGPQDLLLDGSLPAPRDRVLVLRRTLAGWYGTPFRHRLGSATGAKVQVAVRLRGGRLGLAEVRAAEELAGLLIVHTGGRVLATGELRLEPAAGDPGLRFDLGADAGGLVSSGAWADLRRRSYAASRAGDPGHSAGSSTHRAA